MAARIFQPFLKPSIAPKHAQLTNFEPESLRARTVHVRVHPPPTTFAERRAVLLALQRTGPIEVFKKLPANFMAVTEQPDTARQLIENSPFEFQVVLPSAVGEVRGGAAGASTVQTQLPLWGVSLRPAVFPVAREAAMQLAENAGRQSGPQPVVLSIKVTPYPYYRHRGAIENSLLHGPWTPTWDPGFGPDTATLASWVLQPSVPPGIAARGLARWCLEGTRRDRDNVTMKRARHEQSERDVWERENMLPGAMAGLVGEDSKPRTRRK